MPWPIVRRGRDRKPESKVMQYPETGRVGDTEFRSLAVSSSFMLSHSFSGRNAVNHFDSTPLSPKTLPKRSNWVTTLGQVVPLAGRKGAFWGVRHRAGRLANAIVHILGLILRFRLRPYIRVVSIKSGYKRTPFAFRFGVFACRMFFPIFSLRGTPVTR